MTELDRFLAAGAREIERRAGRATGATATVLQRGARAFAGAVERATPKSAPPVQVPVVEHLGTLPRSPLADAAVAASSELRWTASPRTDDAGHQTALAPLNQVRDFGDVTVGLMLLAPGATYPLHSHPPQELYLPIADGGRWRFGGSDVFRELDPEELVYNHPNDLHSVVAGAEPLLALYVLWP